MLDAPPVEDSQGRAIGSRMAVGSASSAVVSPVLTPVAVSARTVCARCGRRYRQASRYGDRFCSNECAFDSWAETGAYPSAIPTAGTARPKRVLSERQLAARRAGLAKARAARLARIDGAKQAGQYQRPGTAASDADAA